MRDPGNEVETDFDYTEKEVEEEALKITIIVTSPSKRLCMLNNNYFRFFLMPKTTTIYRLRDGQSEVTYQT